MATLTDLVQKPFSEYTSEELQEKLREIRRSRRMPPAKVKTPREKKPAAAKEMTAEEALEMLKLLGEDINV